MDISYMMIDPYTEKNDAYIKYMRLLSDKKNLSSHVQFRNEVESLD